MDCSQAPLSVAFPGKEYWSGLPFPSPGNLPYPGIEPASLASLALASVFFTTEPSGKPQRELYLCLYMMAEVHILGASLVAQMAKNLPANVGEPGLIPWRREWLPTPVSNQSILKDVNPEH